MSEHTELPWRWVIHDSSAASIEGPKEMIDHVLTVSPCKHCRGEDWEWGACTNPTLANANFIIDAVNSYTDMQASLVNAQNAEAGAKLLCEEYAAMVTWRDIETAPIDGPAFLVWTPENLCTYEVIARDGNLLIFGAGFRDILHRATHWMPLPKPPSGNG